MFNRWRAYPKRKPKEGGFYLCTIGLDGGEYVLRLWYSETLDGWLDLRRKKIFDGYDVRHPETGKRLYGDDLCNRTDDVIAWKKLPKPKKVRRKK